MSDKNVIANTRQWKSVPAEERSKRMSALAKGRMSKLTPRQRKRIARKLVNARAAKREKANAKS